LAPQNSDVDHSFMVLTKQHS